MWPQLITKDTGGKYDILTRDDGKVIAIDATSNYTHRVNVLVIENEEVISE